jgi:LmbE family N-acetylglucosaminyl deacetylase
MRNANRILALVRSHHCAKAAGIVVFILCGIARGTAPATQAAPAPEAVLQELRSFDQMGSVLYIAAHPDDENTQLIAYLARGRNYRTAYLSLTRGDGGQNVLGPELGPELGVIRTEELLAARRVDGGRQFFSRALDFGFSKDYRQTLQVWDRQEVLADIVRVIRTFRPDVVVTRFSTVPGNTHGHHTASAILGLEAFKLAGDPKAFPEQLTDLTPWQPKRIFSNGFGIGLRGPSGASATTKSQADIVRISISGKDPVTGLTFAELAARSRSMHKSQGFGNFTGFGGRGASGVEAFQLLDGEPATHDIMDGIDTSWNRFSMGEIGKMTDDLIVQFNGADLSANVPALLEIKKRLDAAVANPIVDEKRALLDHIIAECLGLQVATTTPSAKIVPGETFTLQYRVASHSDIPVNWLDVRFSGPEQKGVKRVSLALGADKVMTFASSETLPTTTPVSQPYWFREPGTAGMFRVDDAKLIGRPENPPVFPVQYDFEVGGQTLVVPDEPVAVEKDAAGLETPRRLDVIPPVSLQFVSEVQLFAPGSPRSVTVELTAYRPGCNGILKLVAPEAWKIDPSEQAFHLGTVGERASLTFAITAPAQPSAATIMADAAIGGLHFNNERIEIRYSHLPFILLQPPAQVKAVALDLAIQGHSIGYIAGAGDNTAEALRQMGYSVTELGADDLTLSKLNSLDAIVCGIRAFNVRTDLATHMPDIFAYVQGGGTVVAQYNRPDGLKVGKIAPFDLALSQQRVTDPNAAMTFLAPDNPVLNTPNKITQADFAGWVQERGTYFPNRWDDHFTPILSCSDAGEAPLKGGLLVARSGKGYFVYTGLTFFRQLPAGVPGAYRLFANLVSLGK